MNMKWLFPSATPFNFKRFLQSRSVVIASYLVCLMPLLYLSFYFSHRMSHLKHLENELQKSLACLEQIEQTQNGLHDLSLSSIDSHNYIKDVVEPIPLLKTEIESLKRIGSHPEFCSAEGAKRMLKFFIEKENRLCFSEQNREIRSGVEELELIQKTPVEVNVSDLKAILSAIEGISTESCFCGRNRPYFVVKEFHLNRQESLNLEWKTYLLKMHLIKRGRLK